MERKEEVVTRTVEEKKNYLVSFDGEITVDVTGMDGWTDEYKESLKEIVDYEKCVRGQLVRKMMDRKVFISLDTLKRKLDIPTCKLKADWLLNAVDCHLSGARGCGDIHYYLFMPETEDDIKYMLTCLALAQGVREFCPGTNFDKLYTSKCGSSDIKCGGTYVLYTEDGSLVSCSWADIFDWNRMAVAVQSMAKDMRTLFAEAMSGDNVEGIED